MVDELERGELIRDETPAERVDRNFNELLGELRIALPGVQVLFAFLLTVPFAQRFSELTGFERGVYFSVLLLTALACALLIAPTAYHRLQFRRGRKREILRFANRSAVLGLGVLALAMTGAILLITDLLFGTAAAIPVGVAAALMFGTLWYLLPLRRGGAPPADRDQDAAYSQDGYRGEVVGPTQRLSRPARRRPSPRAELGVTAPPRV